MVWGEICLHKLGKKGADQRVGMEDGKKTDFFFNRW